MSWPNAVTAVPAMSAVAFGTTRSGTSIIRASDPGRVGSSGSPGVDVDESGGSVDAPGSSASPHAAATRASATIDVVVADHTLGDVDDLGRLLRQVHRVMKSSRPFVISVPHPFAGVYQTDEYGSKVQPYGTVGRTIGDWFIHLARANFRVDQILELGVSDISPVPTTLVLRAVKEGD